MKDSEYYQDVITCNGVDASGRYRLSMIFGFRNGLMKEIFLTRHAFKYKRN